MIWLTLAAIGLAAVFARSGDWARPAGKTGRPISVSLGKTLGTAG